MSNPDWDGIETSAREVYEPRTVSYYEVLSELNDTVSGLTVARLVQRLAVKEHTIRRMLKVLLEQGAVVTEKRWWGGHWVTAWGINDAKGKS